MIHLKQKDLAEYRNKLLREQDYLCAMCKQEIKNVAALDHDHKLGHCRAVACRECNALEGKIVNSARMCGMTEEHLDHFLANISSYWTKDYSNNPLHPKHLTEDDKKLKLLKKKRKMLKTDRAKPKYDKEIKELQEKIKNTRKYWNE